jgi:hypothetical protein
MVLAGAGGVTRLHEQNMKNKENMRLDMHSLNKEKSFCSLSAFGKSLKLNVFPSLWKDKMEGKPFTIAIAL